MRRPNFWSTTPVLANTVLKAKKERLSRLSSYANPRITKIGMEVPTSNNPELARVGRGTSNKHLFIPQLGNGNIPRNIFEEVRRVVLFQLIIYHTYVH